jgi:hypothetical protein
LVHLIFFKLDFDSPTDAGAWSGAVTREISPVALLVVSVGLLTADLGNFADPAASAARSPDAPLLRADEQQASELSKSAATIGPESWGRRTRGMIVSLGRAGNRPHARFPGGQA